MKIEFFNAKGELLTEGEHESFTDGVDWAKEANAIARQLDEALIIREVLLVSKVNGIASMYALLPHPAWTR